MLTKTKTQPPPHTTRNAIYQIPCKDCNATYCGQTRRPLYLRLSEHQRFTNSKSFTSTDLQYTSAVAHHAHTTGHTIDFKSTHILSSLTKSSQLDLIEHAAIKIICPSLNKLHSAPNINNQWTLFACYSVLSVYCCIRQLTKFTLNEKISCQETGNDENIVVFANLFYGSI